MAAVSVNLHRQIECYYIWPAVAVFQPLKCYSNTLSEPMKHPTEVEIIPFSEALSEPIKTLNYEWLEKYFRVEEGLYERADIKMEKQL